MFPPIGSRTSKMAHAETLDFTDSMVVQPRVKGQDSLITVMSPHGRSETKILSDTPQREREGQMTAAKQLSGKSTLQI